MKNNNVRKYSELFPIVVDYENKTIKIGKVIIDEFLLGVPRNENRDYGMKLNFASANGYNLHNEDSIDNPEIRKLLRKAHNNYCQSMNKIFCRLFGNSFNHRLYATQYALFIKPYEKIIYKYCVKYYSPTCVKFCPDMIKSCHQNIETIKQAMEDGLQNIVSFIIIFGKNPQQLKKFLGKGLWKKLCSNSTYKNILISHAISWISNSNFPLVKRDFGGNSENPDNLKQVLNILLNLKTCNIRLISRSNIMQYVFDNTYITILEYCYWANCNFKNLTHRKLINESNIFIDTYNMAAKINRRFNLKWTSEKMHKMHDIYSEELIRREYSTETFEHFKNLSLEIICNNFKCTLLDSSSKIATEGLKMKNCVANYCERVASGKYYLYHIEEIGGTSNSTVGFRINENNKLAIDQHYGPCNSIIDNEEIIAAARKIERILRKELKENT